MELGMEPRRELIIRRGLPIRAKNTNEDKKRKRQEEKEEALLQQNEEVTLEVTEERENTSIADSPSNEKVYDDGGKNFEKALESMSNCVKSFARKIAEYYE